LNLAGPGKNKENAIGLKLNTLTYDLKWSSDAEKKFGLTIGSQGMFQQNENFGKEMLVPNADVSDIAAFALLRYDIGKWNFLAAEDLICATLKLEAKKKARLIHWICDPKLNLNKITSYQRSIGVAFRPDDQWTLKATLHPDSAPELCGTRNVWKHEGTYRFEIGNEDLKIEQNLESDLGVKWETKSVAIELSGYYNFIDNYIFIGQRGDSIGPSSGL